jgi:hypothetical protein
MGDHPLTTLMDGMKLVETSGTFQYLCSESRQLVEAHRPTVVKMSTFFSSKVADSTLRLLADLKAEATDLDFQKYWVECKNDAKLAVESFKSEFGLVSEPKEAPKAKEQPKKAK